jgi:hypothetical protein
MEAGDESAPGSVNLCSEPDVSAATRRPPPGCDGKRHEGANRAQTTASDHPHEALFPSPRALRRAHVTATSSNGRCFEAGRRRYLAMTNLFRLSTRRMLTGTVVRYPVFGSIVIVPVAAR